MLDEASVESAAGSTVEGAARDQARHRGGSTCSNLFTGYAAVGGRSTGLLTHAEAEQVSKRSG